MFQRKGTARKPGPRPAIRLKLAESCPAPKNEKDGLATVLEV